MGSLPEQWTLNEATTSLLLSLVSSDDDETNKAQLRHRLNILQAWFGDNQATASETLSKSTILEIGPGQGDMTVPLAHFAQKILAVDNAPMDYGSPFTLEMAQARINKSELGPRIHWIQSEIIDYAKKAVETGIEAPDYIIMAHSLFYITSEEYFVELLQSLQALAATRKEGQTKTKLLIAEWGMRGSEAHILAAKAQAVNPLTDGNVRTIFLPEKVKKLGAAAGWKVENETWMESPELEDGQWDVDLAKTMAYEEKVIPVGPELLEMEKVVEKLGGEPVKCMDVWTSVFTL